ncbi:large ribosomal subunit protein bL9m-like [Clavelina lepadiformis]|uniref:Large ribosomal subunit protein bL9m n=1 Tax=Clavelina lepadiformis TaxID=159417 RepID=A0ABP0EYE0_CLALP
MIYFVGGRLLKTLAHFTRQSCALLQTTATSSASTLKLARHNKAPLPKLGRPAKLTELHQVYKVVGRDNGPKNLKFILTEDVSEFGVKGEMLDLPKHFGRRLIFQGKAVYASPENIEEYSAQQLTSQSVSGRRMILWLKEQTILPCSFRKDVEWTLTPELLARSLLRTHNLSLVPSAITLPDYPITNRNVDEDRVHEIKVTVNELDTIPLKITITGWEPTELNDIELS